MGEETCETCRFWSKDGIAGDGDVMGNGDSSGCNSGECRRHAPSIIMAMAPRMLLRLTTTPSKRNGPPEPDTEGEDARRVFPITYCWDFCGEHQPRKPLPVVPPTT